MATLSLIGIGTGNPDHLTGQARRAIAQADLILIPHKGSGKSDLADLRQRIVADIRPLDGAVALFDMPERSSTIPYFDAVDAWHDEIAQIWATSIARHPTADSIALLVWGDPSLYDSTLRIAARLSPMPQIEVIPGLTSLQVLTAAHTIPLNTLGGAVVITTGRRLRDEFKCEPSWDVCISFRGGCEQDEKDAAELHQLLTTSGVRAISEPASVGYDHSSTPSEEKQMSRLDREQTRISRSPSPSTSPTDGPWTTPPPASAVHSG